MKFSLQDLLYRISHAICVCRCIACGELIASDRVLCEDCEPKYRLEKMDECGACSHALSACLCPGRMLLRHGIRRHVKLYRYHSHERDAVGNRILLRLKRRNVETCFRFLGRELAEAVKRQIPLDGDFVISYIPRTRRRVAEFGFDQSERIAKRLSLELGIPFLKTLSRERRGKMQKAMSTVEERHRNATESLALSAPSLKGKRVLLVDDIVTSGASMCAAAKLLRRAEAREIIAVSVAAVMHTPNLRAEAAQNSHLPYYMR